MKNLYTHIYGFFVILVGLTRVGVAQAQAPMIESKKTPYEIACGLLEKGRNLETAITILTKLVEQKPQSADYHLALGCALTSRLASISCVTENVKISFASTKFFEKRVKIWEKMQDDTHLPLYGTPKPTLPVFNVTPDDQKVYDPLKEKEPQKTKDLTEKSVRSFRTAYRLSRTFPLKRKTQLDYTFGWGMLLLYRFAGESLVYERAQTPETTAHPKSKEQKEREEKTFFHDEVISAFQECANSDKKRVDYLQSLAFAEAPNFLKEANSTAEREQLAESKVNRMESAIRHLKNAQKKSGGNEDLSYQLAIFCLSDEPDTALIFLKQMALQSNNTVAHYLLAVALDAKAEKQADSNEPMLKQEMLDAIEAGNHATDYRSLALTLPLPRFLAPAWNYREFYGMGSEEQILVQAFSLFSLPPMEKTATESALTSKIALRRDILLMEFGLASLRRYVGSDLSLNAPRAQLALYNRAFYGFISCGKANRRIKELAIAFPTPENTALARRYAEMEPYWQAWDEALIN